MGVMVIICFTLWVSGSARHQLKIEMYQSTNLTEWILVLIIFCTVMLPKVFDFLDQWRIVRQFVSVAAKLEGNPPVARGMMLAALTQVIDTLQPSLAMALSFYVATFMCEGVFLNLILNVVALDFLGELDSLLIAAFIRSGYGDRASVCFAVLDITYGVHEHNRFWNESDSSKPLVLEALTKDASLSNADKWSLLTSSTAGLGLLGRLEDGQTCVLGFRAQVYVMDWTSIGDEELSRVGGLYLAATTDFTWQMVIRKRQRALLFRHFPSIARDKPWSGVVKFRGGGLTDEHAEALGFILNHNKDLYDLDATENAFGDRGTIQIFDALRDNVTLTRLGLCACGLTDESAEAFARLLQRNSSLQYVWLSSNRGISEKGLSAIAAELAVSGSNTTLRSLYIADIGVSEDFKRHCIEITNGRIEF